MSIRKIIQDHFYKHAVLGRDFLPRELFELASYFRTNGNIHFDFKKENGKIIAISTNFRYGSIITSGATPEELDKNIKDAILTAFDVPSSYAKEANIRNAKEEHSYAIA